MPRVLIEMGFVSNKEEGAFLNSESGQNKLAEAIANSILEYKKEYFSATSTAFETNNVDSKEWSPCFCKVKGHSDAIQLSMYWVWV